MKLELFIREWCPWCVKARATLDRLGYAYTIRDLEVEEGAREFMAEISGQERVPTLKVGDLVLPDFGPDDLLAFLETHEITAEKSHHSES